MAQKKQFDIAVIGAGSGGLVAAKFAAGIGKRVVLVEKNKIGGECTWTGCVPSKALINLAHHATSAQTLKDLGITGDELKLDTSKIMPHVQSIVEGVYSTETPEVLEREGIDEVVIGSPVFRDATTFEVNETVYEAAKIILCTGSHPAVPPIEGLEGVPFHTNETIFNLEKLPESLVIIGGGPIGVEMACAFHALGTRVSVIEMSDRVMPREERELAIRLTEQMQRRGINVMLTSKVTKAARTDIGVVVMCELAGGATLPINANELLVAVGRTPNIQGLNLEAAGVAYDKKGITVDDYLRTSASNIYACGDVIGSYQFSHVAERQAIVAARNALLPLRKKMDYSNVGWVTFADPEFAALGFTSVEALKKHGRGLQVYDLDYSQIDRGRTDGEEHGFARVLCDRRGRIVGAHILGARAGEVIHELQAAKTMRIPLHKLDRVIHFYPTYSGVVKKIARRAYVDRLQRNVFLKVVRWIAGKVQGTK